MLKFFFRPLQPDSSQFLHLCDELERRRCHLHDKVIFFLPTALIYHPIGFGKTSLRLLLGES